MDLKETILLGIGRNGLDFSINADAALTEKITCAIQKQDWNFMEKSAASTTAKAKEETTYVRSMNGHLDAIMRMRQSRAVTVLMPEHTRFAFVKKIFKKCNMATTRFQEEFNTAALDAACALAEYALDADQRIKRLKESHQRLENIIHRMMLEQERLRKTVEELKRDR